MTDTPKGILLMVLAMLGLAFTDTFVKLLSASMPSTQVILIVGTGTALVFSAAALAMRQKLFSRRFFHPAVLGRSAAEALASVTVTAAIATAPLSTVSAIMQTNPILVTLGAALFFGERVGWRRWLAVAAGLAGMLMILRPGTGAIEPGLIFAVVAAAALSARDLTTRAAPRDIPGLALSAWGFAFVPPVALALLLALPPGPAPLQPGGAWLAAGAIACTVLGYYALTASVRLGELAAVAPFRYTRLVFATAIGMSLFAERPDGWTVAGSLLIIGAGLYAFLRERRRATVAPA